MRKFIIAVSVLAAASCANTENTVIGNLDIYEDFESKHVEARPVRVWTPSDYDPEQKYEIGRAHV